MVNLVLQSTNEQLYTLASGINLTWVMTVTFLIFFMHAGFAMLESGQVRSKNVANQLTKNMLTWAVGVVVFFIIGAGISAFVGQVTGSGTYSSLTQFGSDNWTGWLYGAVFAMTAATIVSGAVAGRAKLRAYVTYTFLLAAIIYPVVNGLQWYSGWLASGVGFHDFAGGMVVHGVGGIAGLTAAWVLGPRMDRYNDDGSVNVIPGHSMTFAVLGTLVLAFGWYGFNVGTASMLNISATNGALEAVGINSAIGRVAMSTTLGMAMGGIGAGAVSLALTEKVDTLYVANGMLAGLVGVTGTANVLTPMGALVIGAIVGGQLPLVFRFVERQLKIDDVCAVFPVHGSAGMIGAVLYPFFSINGSAVGSGLVPGGILSIEAGQFVPQIIGVLTITVWTVAATAAVWGALKAIGEARVTPDHEQTGLDRSEHGVETYPEFGEPDFATDGGTRTDDDTPEIRTDGGTNIRPDGGENIELVMAYIRPEKLGDVKEGLVDAGIQSLTVVNVSGRGSQEASKGQWRGEEYNIDLHRKVKIECVVSDVPTEDVIDAIEAHAKTGEKGDGKIFVVPVSDAVQIRTGKRGPPAV